MERNIWNENNNNKNYIILKWKVHSSKKNKSKERGYHRSRFEKCSRSKPSRIPEDFAQGLNEPQCREEKDGVIYSTLVVSQPLVLQTRMFLVIRILPRLFNAWLLVFHLLQQWYSLHSSFVQHGINICAELSFKNKN